MYVRKSVQILSKGKMKFLMPEYINSILEEAPVDMASTGVTPAASNLFTVRKDVNKLDNEMAKTCHHLTAMLLYLCKRARPEIGVTDRNLIPHNSGDTT
jgi:hypothetical protein